MMMPMLVAIAIVSQNPIVSGDRSIVSKCEVSADAEYGYTQEKPIRVGGSPMYGPARQKRFLQALVGPAGQPIAFRRIGSLAPNADGIILDLYELKYPGLEKPFELYLDLYRWDPPKAPRGLICGAEIGLAPPGPDPFEPRAANPSPAPAPRPSPIPGGMPRMLAWNQVVARAIDAGTREELPPMPLEPYGSTRYGVAFEPFVRVARVSRRSGGRVPDEMQLSAFSVETLLVAFPLTCAGATAKPQDMTMVTSGRTMSRRVEVLRGEALQRALPAYDAPADSIGVVLMSSMLPAGALTITYDRAPCAGQTPSVTLNVLLTRSENLQRVAPVWPEGVPVPPEGVVRVTLHALTDHEGVASEITVVDGPEAFHAAAIAAVKASRHGAVIVNGVASRLPRPMATVITFTPPRF